jgi:hypothetical protein
MSVLMIAATIGGLISAMMLLVIALWTRQIWLTKFVLGATSIWFASYGAMLFGFSLLSEEKTLELIEAKAFRGFYLDCHSPAEATDVRKTKTFGDRTASGEFYTVKVKVLSDAEHAEDVTLSGNSFEREVPAGVAFEDEIVFDPPIDTRNLRLDIAEGIGTDKIIEAILIDDKDSVLQRRNYVNLEEQRQTVGVK